VSKYIHFRVRAGKAFDADWRLRRTTEGGVFFYVPAHHHLGTVFEMLRLSLVADSNQRAAVCARIDTKIQQAAQEWQERRAPLVKAAAELEAAGARLETLSSACILTQAQVDVLAAQLEAATAQLGASQRAAMDGPVIELTDSEAELLLALLEKRRDHEQYPDLPEARFTVVHEREFGALIEALSTHYPTRDDAEKALAPVVVPDVPKVPDAPANAALAESNQPTRPTNGASAQA
jgi:hypothetical protein